MSIAKLCTRILCALDPLSCSRRRIGCGDMAREEGCNGPPGNPIRARQAHVPQGIVVVVVMLLVGVVAAVVCRWRGERCPVVCRCGGRGRDVCRLCHGGDWHRGRWLWLWLLRDEKEGERGQVRAERLNSLVALAVGRLLNLRGGEIESHVLDVGKGTWRDGEERWRGGL